MKFGPGEMYVTNAPTEQIKAGLRMQGMCFAGSSLEYPGSVRRQNCSAPQLCLEFLWAAVVTARAALPQIRVEVLIGSQANYEITLKIMIYLN